MSLVYDVLEFVNNNPGKTGLEIQNKITHPLVPASINELEGRGLITWENDGYFALAIKELKGFYYSLDDIIKSIEKIVQGKISAKCINCKFFAEGETDVRSFFGFRRTSGIIIPESYCRKCQTCKVISIPALFGNESSPKGEVIKHFVKEAKNMRYGIYIEGVVIRKESPRTVTLKDGRKTRVCSAFLIDDYDNQIKINLWSHDVDLVKNGHKIRINNGYTVSYREEVCVNAGKYGHIQILHYGPNTRPRKSFKNKFAILEDKSSFDNYIIESSDIEKNSYLNNDSKNMSEIEVRKQDFNF